MTVIDLTRDTIGPDGKGTTPPSNLEDPDDPIMEELKELREERKAWRARELELQKTIAAQTTALSRQEKLAESINRLRPVHRHVHAIALRLIFDALLPPVEFFNTGISLGDNSPYCHWMKTKRILTQVCKTWRVVALPMLYQDIAIRRLGQIHLLQRTFWDNPKYATWVRSLEIGCHVLEGLLPICHPALFYIASSCTFARSITIGPNLIMDPPPSESRQAMIMGILGTLNAHTTELRYHCHFDTFWTKFNVLHPGGTALANLVYLEIEGIALPPEESLPRELCRLTLPKLDIISFVGGTGRIDLERFTFWSLPKLREARFHPYVGEPPLFFGEFLKAQPNLRTLDIGCRPIHMEGLARKCANTLAVLSCTRPHIKRLVLPSDGRTSPHLFETLLVDHPLDYVDVWISPDDARDQAIEDLSRRFPRWKRVRLIDQGLSLIPNLPHLLPPPPLSNSQSFTRIHNIYGLRIVETDHSIFRSDAPVGELEDSHSVFHLCSGGYNLAVPAVPEEQCYHDHAKATCSDCASDPAFSPPPSSESSDISSEPLEYTSNESDDPDSDSDSEEIPAVGTYG